MDGGITKRTAMNEGQLLMLLKEIYGSHVHWTGVQLQRVQMLVSKVEEIEREACARVCDAEASAWEQNSDGQVSIQSIAAAIRARGKKHE